MALCNPPKASKFGHIFIYSVLLEAGINVPSSIVCGFHITLGR